MGEKLEGNSQVDYYNDAKEILEYAKANISSYNFNPNNDAIWGMPKRDEDLFEMYIIEAIASRLKTTVMEKTPVATSIEVSMDGNDRIYTYFATTEDAYRFSGWYAAISGFYKESARARINLLG